MLLLSLGISLIAGIIAKSMAWHMIVKHLSLTIQVMQDLAKGEGDLTQRLAVTKNDEISEVARCFNIFMDKMHDIVYQVKETAEGVSQASEQLSHATGLIASGAQEQAASIEETAASLEQLTGTVRQNADNAQRVSQLGSDSRATADKGQQAVNAAVSSMAGINVTAQKIADIITVIDDIAFQTNLLALNAAVEAARAGEQGRDFPVVAAEVRNLAKRSAAAAKEIKALIQDSVQRVNNGSALVNGSGQTLTEIVDSVN
jgi:methyl-accepting chemotaxis protein